MQFDYPYLGPQLPIRAVGHSITQQPFQTSAAAANTPSWGVTAPLLCGTPGMAADHPCWEGGAQIITVPPAFVANDERGLSSLLEIGGISGPQIAY